MGEETRGRRIHERWAHLRFSVVGQLLAAPPDKGELKAAIEGLAARTWRHPTTGEPVRFGFSTIERWYYRALRERTDPVPFFAASCAPTPVSSMPSARRFGVPSLPSTAPTRAGASSSTTTISSLWPRRNPASSPCLPIPRCAAS